MTDLKRVMVGLAQLLVDNDNRRTPKYNFDGSDIKSAGELAATMGITRTEATLRFETKDVQSGMAPMAVQSSLGTRTTDAVGKGKKRSKKSIIDRARGVALSQRMPTR